MKTKPSAVALFLVTLVVYLLFPTRNYYWDGVAFAWSIEHPRWFRSTFFHRHHLIYNAFGMALWDGVRRIGMSSRALHVLQTANSVLAAVAVVVLYQILLDRRRDLYVALSFSALLALCATWWKFATDANAYVPSILFLLLSFRLVLPGRGPRPIVLACFHAIAMLFHQIAALFFPVAMLGLFFQAPARNRISAWIKYCALTAVITIVAYYAGFRLNGMNGGFIAWSTGHSPDVSFSFNLWKNLQQTIIGNLRLFAGGRVALWMSLPAASRISLAALLLGLSSLLVAVVLKYRPKLHVNWRDQLVLLCGLWVAVYLVFFFFYLPHNTFYRLFYLPPIVLILASLVAKDRHYRSALLVTVLALWNFSFYILPYSRIEANRPLELALRLNRVWNSNTLVYQGVFNADNWLMFYFNPSARWKDLKAPDSTVLHEELAEIYRAGGNAWIDAAAADLFRSTLEGERWLEQHTRASASYQVVNGKHRISFHQLFP